MVLAVGWDSVAAWVVVEFLLMRSFKRFRRRSTNLLGFTISMRRQTEFIVIVFDC